LGEAGGKAGGEAESDQWQQAGQWWFCRTMR
jgi:hypothetical protein